MVKTTFGFYAHEKLMKQLLNENIESPESNHSENMSFTSITEPTTSKNSAVWNRNSILRLIYYYKEMQEKIKSTTIRNEKVFKEIAEKLNAEGLYFTGTQCRDKFKYLKMKYNKYKDSQKQTGSEYVAFDYADEFEELFGKKHTINPVKVLSSLEPNTKGKISRIKYVIFFITTALFKVLQN